MIPEINPELARRFRSKVHENNDFIRCYFTEYKIKRDEPGIDIWSKICSCMDWLTVATEGLEKPKYSKNMNKSALEFTHFLITIDMILEAIDNLWKSISPAINKKRPYINDNRIFQAEEFGKKFNDEDYFKEIRAWFGIHSVNGNERKVKINEGNEVKARFFSSWSSNSSWLNSSEELTFSLQLYSNNHEAERIYGGRKEIKIKVLLEFIALRYQTLNELMEEIDGLYLKEKKKLQDTPIEWDRDSNELVQVNQLYKQAQKRKLTSEHYEDQILLYKSFLECDLEVFELADRQVIINYLNILKSIIPIYKDIVQNVDNSEFDDFEKFHLSSQVYFNNFYEFSKVLEYAGDSSFDDNSEIDDWHSVGFSSLKFLIEDEILPAYSMDLTGNCLELLIHALDYEWSQCEKVKK
ncbi:hypothetical protein P4L29_16755 [Bacillus cereus]|nr:hypothetical protein [Bacillus cereus]